VVLAVINQCTKFEVSRFTRYETMNGGAKCKKMRCFRAIMVKVKVMGNATVR